MKLPLSFFLFYVKELDRKLHTLVWSSSLNIQSTSAFSNSTFKGGVAHHAFDITLLTFQNKKIL